jgi:hypothetical protein
MRKYVYSAALAASMLTLNACEKNASANDVTAAFGGAPPLEEAASVADCAAANLSLVSEGDGTFAFVNNGKSACSMQGYPGVSPLNSGKAPMTSVRLQRDEAAKPKLVVLEPKGKAVFMLASDKSYGACTTAPAVEASLPGQKNQKFTANGEVKICGDYVYLTALQAPAKG